MALFKQSVERGVNFLNAGDFSQAAGELSIAVGIQPENTVVLRYLGSAYARNKQRDEARRVLQAAINLEPKNPAAHYELAQVALAAGDLDMADRETRQVVALDPTNRKARELIGILQYRQGALAEAVATLAPLTADGGSRRESAYVLALCYQGLERYEEARDLLRKVVERDPGFAEAWLDLGKVLTTLGDEAGAAAAKETFAGLRGDKTPGDASTDTVEPEATAGPPAGEN